MYAEVCEYDKRGLFSQWSLYKDQSLVYLKLINCYFLKNFLHDTCKVLMLIIGGTYWILWYSSPSRLNNQHNKKSL